MATIDEIKQQAAAVKNATQVGENTAERVGGALSGLAEIAKEQEDNIRKKANKAAVDAELAKKANTADVNSKFTEEKNRVDAELDKKFNKESIVQESGDAEDKVMSQKATTTAIADETTRAKAAEEAIIFDVSAHNDSATFESLSALLGDANLSTLIPTSVRHGGMSIRFIRSSDNKYVQYRLMSNTFSTTSTDWQGVDDYPTEGSSNLVKSGGVKFDIRENVGLNLQNFNAYDQGTIIEDATFLKQGDILNYTIIPSGTSAGIRLLNGSTTIETYGQVSGLAAGVPISGTIVVPANLTKIVAVWGNYTLNLVSEKINSELNSRIKGLKSDIVSICNNIEDTLQISTGSGQYKTIKYTPIPNKRIYLTVADENSIIIDYVNINFKGTGILLTKDIYTNREYSFDVPNGCTNIELYISSSSISKSGTLIVKIKEGYVNVNEKKIGHLENSVGNTAPALLLNGGNIFDKKKIILGYQINSYGVLRVNTAFNTTDFISIEPDSYLSVRYVPNLSLSAYYYNSQKEFISSDLIHTKVYSQIPSGARFIRFLFNSSIDANNIFVVNANIPLVNECIYKEEFSGSLSESSKLKSNLICSYGLGSNLFDSSNIYLNRNINISTQEIEYSNTRFVSDKIYVLPYHRYYSNSNALIYSSDNTIIGNINTGGSSTFAFMPSNASYIRLSANINDLSKIMFILVKDTDNNSPTYEAFRGGKYIPNDILNLPFIQKYCRDDKNSGFWTGKKLTIDGDSISHDSGLHAYWQYVLKNNLKMDIVGSSFVFEGQKCLIGTSGIGGSRIAVGTEGNNKQYCISLRYEELPSDADLIIIAGGTNDWAHSGVELGTMADRTNITFYGALHVLCLGLINRYPSKQIVFMTPIKRDTSLDSVNNLGLTLKQFADAIKEVCAYYGIPVCDMFSNCCMNPSIDAQRALYFADYTHPNLVGHKKMGDIVTGFISNLI